MNKRNRIILILIVLVIIRIICGIAVELSRKNKENLITDYEYLYSNQYTDNIVEDNIESFPKGITIYEGEEVSQNLAEPFGYNFEVLTDKETIKNAREQLDTVLNKYPKGFWDELLLGENCDKKSLVICLVGELSNNNEGYSNPTGMSTYDSDAYYVFIDSSYAGPDGANVEGTIFHELMHIIDYYLQDIGENYSEWENYLPNNFEYTGYTDNHPERDFNMCIDYATDNNDVWFDGIYATESVLEDRACMMSSMYYDGLLYYKKYPHLYARMKYLYEILYKNFASIRNCGYDWLE